MTTLYCSPSTKKDVAAIATSDTMPKDAAARTYQVEAGATLDLGDLVREANPEEAGE